MSSGESFGGNLFSLTNSAPASASVSGIDSRPPWIGRGVGERRVKVEAGESARADVIAAQVMSG